MSDQQKPYIAPLTDALENIVEHGGGIVHEQCEAALAAWSERTPLRGVEGLKEAAAPWMTMDTWVEIMNSLEPLLFGEREPTR